MAIIKNMQTKFGIALSYHRITALSINYAAKKAVICVASYLSKEARANQSIPLEEIDIEVPSIDFALFQNTNPIAQGYLWLKENVVGFDESLDDFEIVEPQADDPCETETPV